MDIEIPANIALERMRQIEVEEYSSSHDDAHDGGELFVAATVYWHRAIGNANPTRVVGGRRGRVLQRDRFGRPAIYEHESVAVPVTWPWAPQYWKPKTRVRDLERAGALCLAEIDRLKRAGKPADHVEATLGLIVQAYEGSSSS